MIISILNICKYVDIDSLEMIILLVVWYTWKFNSHEKFHFLKCYSSLVILKKLTNVLG